MAKREVKTDSDVAHVFVFINGVSEGAKEQTT